MCFWVSRGALVYNCVFWVWFGMSLRCFGMSWCVLGCLGVFWSVLECLWCVLRCFGMSLRYFGMSWCILSCLDLSSY